MAEAEVDLVWQRQRQPEAEVEKPHKRTPGVESGESIPLREQSTQARDPPWLWQTPPEVQNRGISGPTKRTSFFFAKA